MMEALARLLSLFWDPLPGWALGWLLALAALGLLMVAFGGSEIRRWGASLCFSLCWMLFGLGFFLELSSLRFASLLFAPSFLLFAVREAFGARASSMRELLTDERSSS